MFYYTMAGMRWQSWWTLSTFLFPGPGKIWYDGGAFNVSSHRINYRVPLGSGVCGARGTRWSFLARTRRCLSPAGEQVERWRGFEQRTCQAERCNRPWPVVIGSGRQRLPAAAREPMFSGLLGVEGVDPKGGEEVWYA